MGPCILGPIYCFTYSAPRYRAPIYRGPIYRAPVCVYLVTLQEALLLLKEFCWMPNPSWTV